MKKSHPVWWGVLALVLWWTATGHAAPEVGTEVATGGTGMGAVLLFAALAAMIVLGSPLFVIIGVLAAMCFLLFGDGYALGPCATLDSGTVCGLDIFPAKMADLTTKNVLLAIPFFVVSGAIMSAGDIANRLVNFARDLVGWLPGGLAVATVGGCMFFAAISGSSPVTVIAIGSMMYPALVKAGYGDRFSIGLVTTAGSLGILIPPSIPMLVFAIVASGSAPIDVGELFLAGVLPGVLIGLLLSIYSIITSSHSRTEAVKGVGTLLGGTVAYGALVVGLSAVLPNWVVPTLHLVGVVVFCLLRQRDAFWAVMLPILILGGIYSGLFTPTEAAAVSVVYALVVELFIHRQISVRHLPKILAEAAVMMGTLLIIMALAFALNDFLVEEQIADMAVTRIQEMGLTPVEFLLIINVFLLIVGALMDSISAIMVIAPLLAPIAMKLGIDPIHLGIIFIVNLEIGYLTPPIGINLFVASAAFGKPMGEVMKSVVPFILLMFVGLGLVTYVPTIAMGPVNALRGEDFYEPLPKARGAPGSSGSGVTAEQGDVLAPGEGEVRSMQDITAVTDGLLSLCMVAEEIVGQEDIEPADRVVAWEKEIAGEDITDKAVLALAKAAVAKAGTSQAYAELRTEASTLVKSEWKCEALEKLLGPP